MLNVKKPILFLLAGILWLFAGVNILRIGIGSLIDVFAIAKPLTWILMGAYEEKLMLNKVFDFVVDVHNELKENHEKDVAKKLYTETHFVSLMPFVKRTIESGISEAMFAEFLINFFKTENDSETYSAYMEACSNGIARNASVVARHNALEKSFSEFFKENSENILTTS